MNLKTVISKEIQNLAEHINKLRVYPQDFSPQTW